MINNVVNWLFNGERGASSNSIVEFMEGLPVGTITGNGFYHHPWGPEDFRRCHLLLEAVQEYRARIEEMSAVSDIWQRLSQSWTELTLIHEFSTQNHNYEKMTEYMNAVMYLNLQGETAMKYKGIKVTSCEICGKRDGIHLQDAEPGKVDKYKIVCRHCNNEAPASEELHNAIVLWNRKQEELKDQLTLPLDV